MSHIENIQQLALLLKKTRRTTLGPGEIHGMLTAAVCGPEVIPAARWLPYIFHKTRDFKKLLQRPDTEQLLQVMLQLYDDLLFSIRQATFVPYFGPDTSDEPSLDDARPWCTGFFYGMHLHGDEWLNNESSELAGLTAPIFYIVNPEEARKEIGAEQARELEKRHPQLIEAIRYNVPRIYDFFNVGRDPREKKNIVSA